VGAAGLAGRPTEAHVNQAWSALEAGRGVLLSQAFDTRDDMTALEQDHPELASEVRRLCVLLNQDAARVTPLGRWPMTSTPRISVPSTSYECHRQLPDGLLPDSRRRLAGEWSTLVARVRAIPGQERFGLPPTGDQLRLAAGTGTIVAVNLTSYGCSALILNARHSQSVPLSDLTQDSVIDHTLRFLQAIFPPQRRRRGHRRPD
jgi:hypothetical protein